jgi:membrane dipeptidase
VDHVGIGSDFDGINSSPKGLDDVTQLPSLTKELLRRGYTEKEVRKILGQNFMRIFKACVR